MQGTEKDERSVEKMQNSLKVSMVQQRTEEVQKSEKGLSHFHVDIKTPTEIYHYDKCVFILYH